MIMHFIIGKEKHLEENLKHLGKEKHLEENKKRGILHALMS
jgi:hypothetical protein